MSNDCRFLNRCIDEGLVCYTNPKSCDIYKRKEAEEMRCPIKNEPLCINGTCEFWQGECQIKGIVREFNLLSRQFDLIKEVLEKLQRYTKEE